MPIMVNCTCGNVMSVEDAMGGQTIVCSQCQRVVAVPTVGPGQSTAQPGQVHNPYNPQSAGYAEAASAQGYQQAPAQYYTQAQLGRKAPGRGLLITGGVLSILALLGNAGWSALFVEATKNGKVDVLGEGIYGLLTLVAIAGIVFASLSFASMSWAALTTAIINVVFMLSFLVTVGDISDDDVQGMVYAQVFFTLLATVFMGLGFRQAGKYKKWKTGAA